MSIVEKQDQLTVRPLTGAGGAAVWGLDITKLDEAGYTQVNDLMLEYGAIALHGQAHATVEDLRGFGLHFGDLDVHGFSPTADGFDDVMTIGQLRSEAWHSDVSWKELPPKYSMLLARKVPSLGGATLYANQYKAYEDLSDTMKAFVTPLFAEHDGRQFDFKLSKHPVTHPVVITHPETGKKALYVNRNFTQRIVGLDRDESQAILEYLFKHTTRAYYQFRIDYEPGTIAIWDNRCVLHSPCPDYDVSEERLMQRVTVLSDKRPVQ
jgi:taurine dioxygenase